MKVDLRVWVLAINNLGLKLNYEKKYLIGGDVLNFMVEPANYWNILIISDRGYESREIIDAKNYFERLFPALALLPQLSKQDDRNIQNKLLDIFINSDNKADKINAGFCLRCCISYGIVKAIKTLARQFCTEYSFTIRDILGVVLQDDGREKIILDDDGTTQILIENNGQPIIINFPRFAIEIIAHFNPDRSSLENWAYYKTRHNDDLKAFLRCEYRLLLATDWAILNRVTPRGMQGQSEENIHIINVYHQVYRNDRIQNQQYGKCSEPSQDQLSRMIDLLNERGFIINYNEDLLEKLNQLGEDFRQLEIHPHMINNDEQNPPDALQQFLEPHLIKVLDEAIAHTFDQSIERLKKSHTYKYLVDKFIPSYRLIYVNKMTITKVANELEFTGQSQASRVLKVERFITEVGNYMYDQMRNMIGNFVRQRRGNFDPDLLKNISQGVSDYIAETVTLPAINELKAGRKPPERNSLFAERMRNYLSI